MSWRIGVDIGGTFTDVALVDEDGGRIDVVKVSTTPGDFGEGVVEALQIALDDSGVAASDVTLLSHATTVVTNALLEGKGARTALVCTRGFRDVLEIRRGTRSDLYDLYQDGPAVLVPRHCRLEVTERLDATGAVVTPIDETDIDPIIDFVRQHDLQAVAVSLLYSFLNDAHERLIGERLRAALPGVPVYLSSEVLPEVREFERTSTTAVCAYVAPILESYLRRLEEAVASMGLPSLYIMGSSGGVFEVEEGLRMPAMAVESGPAAGVVAAAVAGRQLDKPNLITFDMGGTTAKASLIKDGVVETTSEYEVGGRDHANRTLLGTGHPVRVPVIDLVEVSAGGGSIAWIDPGRSLRIGPKSAGARPGPVCYGAGGTEPTVTDADLVLGYLNPVHLLGGRLAVDTAAARSAIEEQIATPLGIDLVQAAAGIIAVVNNNMAEALRIVSVERGHDTRDFSLIAFGGAGPVHAAALAAELDIREVIVPPIPGGFSALGLVATDLRRDYARTHYVRLDEADAAAIEGVLDGMEAAARLVLADARIPQDRWHFERAADIRYVRQAYELTVPMQAGSVSRDMLDRLTADFHAAHRLTYGHDNPAEPVQMVNLRLTAVGRLDGLEIRQQGNAGTGTGAAPTRPVWFPESGLAPCPVLAREFLAVDETITGPAIIEAADSTIVVPPGWRAAADDRGFFVMEAP
jgi:N-methylhydantoinase A